MTIASEIRAEAETILQRHGLAIGPLAPTGGIANLVVTTPSHVVRLNEGRFPGAFRFEARVLGELPVTIPHPGVVAVGNRDGGGEYLILERARGASLAEAWPTCDEAALETLGHEVGTLVAHLHALPPAPWMENPWVADALAKGRWGDAYHAPMTSFRPLLASARTARADLAGLLDRVDAWFVAQPIRQLPGELVFVHTDLHERNLLVDGGTVSALIDFEGGRLGAPVMELDMLMRWVVGEGSTAKHRAFLRGMAAGYPDLFAAPDLVGHLEVQEVLWQLVQLHHWQPGATWGTDPAAALEAVLDGTSARRVASLMGPASRRTL